MELPALDAVSNRGTPYAPVSVTIICMSQWLKKLVLAAALLVMPLQGIAATLSVLLCHGGAQAHATHENGNEGHGMQYDGPSDPGVPPGNNAFHPCCHYTVAAIPVYSLPAAPPDFSVRTFVPDSLHDLFIPEQPQRPPLA